MLHICLIMSSCVCYSAGFFGEHVAGGTKALDLERKFTLLAFNCKFLVCFCFFFSDYPAVMHCATLCNAVVLFLRFQKKKLYVNSENGKTEEGGRQKKSATSSSVL